MKVIDTHQHLWDMDRFSFSWCREIPALNRSFLMKDYLEATREVDLRRSIHVEADVDEAHMIEETKFIFSLADRDDTPIEGVVACARPEKPGFQEHLETICTHPKLKGIRRVLHTQPDEVPRRPLFVENLRVLGQYGLSFDLCVLARQLPVAIDLASKCPEVSFILDHCGVPNVKNRILNPWKEHLTEISRFKNVACKISGLVAYADPDDWSVEDLRPFVEHAIESFGWDRVMFGSDWPVCTPAASLKEWFDALSLLTQDAGGACQRKLFYENAKRVYRLEGFSD